MSVDFCAADKDRWFSLLIVTLLKSSVFVSRLHDLLLWLSDLIIWASDSKLLYDSVSACIFISYLWCKGL